MAFPTNESGSLLVDFAMIITYRVLCVTITTNDLFRNYMRNVTEEEITFTNFGGSTKNYSFKKNFLRYHRWEI